MMFSPGLLEKFYREMVRIRMCEESLVVPIIDGEICCPCHLCSGQEAIAVGVCKNLQKTDYLFGTHRSHGHFLAKGGSMKELVAEVFCKETGCSCGRGGSMHLIDQNVGVIGSAPIVAGTISLAMGAALASAVRKDKRVTVSFFGDGATGEGVLYECMNFAALKKLPMIFACENNLYATHMPIRDCRVKNPIFKIAEPFGIESWQIDGNDVLQVYEAAKNAVNKCRQDQGPLFLEFLTYRIRGHVGADDNVQGMRTDIRPREELDAWFQRDPIKNFERYLLDNQIMVVNALERIKEEVQEEVAAAHLFAKQSPQPNEKGLTNYVFNEKTFI